MVHGQKGRLVREHGGLVFDLRVVCTTLWFMPWARVDVGVVSKSFAVNCSECGGLSSSDDFVGHWVVSNVGDRGRVARWRRGGGESGGDEFK